VTYVIWIIKSSCRLRCRNSKVLAHALPGSCTVDRQYTLKFLFGRTDITHQRDQEWQPLRAHSPRVFLLHVQSELLRSQVDEWLGQRKVLRWDTSRAQGSGNLGHRRGKALANRDCSIRQFIRIQSPIAVRPHLRTGPPPLCESVGYRTILTEHEISMPSSRSGGHSTRQSS